MKPKDQPSADFLAIMLENAELRLALATAQDQCVELAVIAGELHGEIDALRRRLAEVEVEVDEDDAHAPRASRPAPANGRRLDRRLGS